MDIYKHCLLSQRKFGGQAKDYEKVHAFMDSSKYFFYHAKHRMLLHHLYGIELVTHLLGNFITNSDGKTILVRDIAAAHCREDLDGQIPTLRNWLRGNEHLEIFFPTTPEFDDPILQHFVWTPFLRTGMKAALLLTCSDFGVYLVERFYGVEKARILRAAIPVRQTVKQGLQQFRFQESWQYTPQQHEIKWLETYEQGELNLKKLNKEDLAA